MHLFIQFFSKTEQLLTKVQKILEHCLKLDNYIVPFFCLYAYRLWLDYKFRMLVHILTSATLRAYTTIVTFLSTHYHIITFRQSLVCVKRQKICEKICEKSFHITIKGVCIKNVIQRPVRRKYRERKTYWKFTILQLSYGMR